MARYRIEEHLASGGMGEVYRARLVSEGGATKTVALKLVRGELAAREDFVTMFVDEARVAMTLSHANVVQAFDVGRVDERWFIAMEYVDGPTLGQLARAHRRIRGEPIPPRLAVTALVEALKGLDYAHRRRDDDGSLLGLVHRDISPGNVLVSREGEVKLTDFGIAKSELTAAESFAGTIKGKIAYMAPEQLRGERVDARADVYAAGVVLFELLSGQRPFDGPDQLALAPDVLSGRRPALSAAVPEVDEELERLVDRAMSVAADSRFESAAAMRQELETFAMKKGWLLSTTDIADMMEELEEEALAPAAAEEATAEPRSHTRLTTFREGPAIGDFDLRLGAELRRVSSDEPVSVFVTGMGELETAPPQAETPVDDDATPQPARWSRTGWGLAGVGLALVGVAVAIVVTDTNATPSVDAAPVAEDETEAVTSVTPALVVAEAESPRPPDETEAVVDSREPAPVADDRGRHAPREAVMGGRTGTLWVASDPWGWVFVDGTRVGRTTLRDHSVRAGRHEIVVRNPPAGLEARATVTVNAGETERVSLTLGGGMR